MPTDPSRAAAGGDGEAAGGEGEAAGGSGAKPHLDAAMAAFRDRARDTNLARVEVIEEALGHLQSGEMSVGAIAQKISLSQSALSQHLAKLRKFKEVDTRRDRQTIYYSCKSDAVSTLLGTLDNIFGEAERR